MYDVNETQGHITLDNNFHNFTMDAGLIEQLVHRQNGTIATALRELITNSIDAGATEIDIQLSSEGFLLKDNGNGFSSFEEVKSLFGRFGTPHQEGDARYGRFRIGRAQVMAFGSMTWRSGRHEMTTDIRGKGYGFDYKQLKAPVPGCQVEGCFYDKDKIFVPITERDLRLFLGYCDTRVTLNGDLISRPPMERETVDPVYEDDDVVIFMPSKGNRALRLYSDGIFVKELNFNRYGISADCISKRALELNTARNDVTHSCPNWRAVETKLLDELMRRKRSGEGWTDHEKEAAIYQLMVGELNLGDLYEVPLIKDVRGKFYSVKQLLITPKPIVCVPAGQEIVGERLATSGLAYAIRLIDMKNWGEESSEGFCTILYELACHCKSMQSWLQAFRNMQPASFDEMQVGVNTDVKICKPRELSKTERAQRSALQAAANRMAKLLIRSGDMPNGKRKIVVGESVGAEAWTDGRSYIAIERRSLTAFEQGKSGLARLISLLLHEYCHGDASLSVIAHDITFYEQFHNSLFSDRNKHIIYECLTTLLVTYERLLHQEGLPLPGWLERETTNQPIILLLDDTKPTLELNYLLEAIGLTPKKGRGRLTINFHGDDNVLGEFYRHCVRRARVSTTARIEQLWEDVDETTNYFKRQGLSFSEEDVKNIIFLAEQRYRAQFSMQTQQDFDHSFLCGFHSLMRIPAFGVKAVERSHQVQMLTTATKHRCSSTYEYKSWDAPYRLSATTLMKLEAPEARIVDDAKADLQGVWRSLSPSVQDKLLASFPDPKAFREWLS